MNKGVIYTRVISAALLLALLIYIGYNVYGAVTDPLKTVTAVEYTADLTIPAVGLIAREERVMSSDYALVSVSRDEGEKVGAGQVVAMAFMTTDAQARQIQIRELEARVEQLTYSSRKEGELVDAKELDASIFQTLSQLKSAVAARELLDVDSSAMELKNLVFKRDYSYAGGAGPEEAIKSLSAQIEELEAASRSDTVALRSAQDGWFSSAVDGYESLLTADFLMSAQPSELNALRPEAVGPKAIGKLITNHRWYFAAVLESAEADKLRELDAVDVRFSQDYPVQLSMDVERVSQPDGQGRCVVVLGSDEELANMSMLRQQSADIILESYSGLRIPKSAMRVNEQGQAGVYCLVGLNAKFKEVSVVYDTGDYYIVLLDKSTTDSLWPGDEVIALGRGLFDGKVVG